ncbi:MAG: hypothetical protein IAF38_04770 [Bacteroidia bacterium]|nr:hypothetical protein [Bacteroidia bacterium]
MSTLTKKYTTFIEKNKVNYFAFISMIILVGGIWGGVASMFIDKNNAAPWQLALNIGVTMATNIAIMGQASFKWVINLTILAVITNGILIAINAF